MFLAFYVHTLTLVEVEVKVIRAVVGDVITTCKAVNSRSSQRFFNGAAAGRLFPRNLTESSVSVLSNVNSNAEDNVN